MVLLSADNAGVIVNPKGEMKGNFFENDCGTLLCQWYNFMSMKYVIYNCLKLFYNYIFKISLERNLNCFHIIASMVYRSLSQFLLLDLSSICVIIDVIQFKVVGRLWFFA